MINIQEKATCTGCSACRDICPVRAIDLVADDEGFLYPRVNIEECIKCGKCDRICPIKNRRKEVNEGNRIIAYAAQTKDEYIRQNSSSGGIFTEIATYIINNGGIVFGAAFDETFKVIHIGVDDTDNLERLRGSKYVQSEIGNTYVQVKTELSPEIWPYEELTSYVITHRNERSTDNIKFVGEAPCELTARLKEMPGKDIWICGGSSIIQPLIRENLIDEYRVSVIPTILGDGILLFGKWETELQLRLKETKMYNGIVELVYTRR